MIDIRPLRSEADYDAALEAVEAYFVSESEPGTPDADRFDLLTLVIADYERRHWELEDRATSKEGGAADKPASRQTLGDAVRAVFGPLGGVEFELPERSELVERDPPDFSDG